MSKKYIVNWKNFYVITKFFEKNPIVISGPRVIIEIDEAVITCRKYNIFFEGFKRGNGKAFIVLAYKRDVTTFLPIIQKHVYIG